MHFVSHGIFADPTQLATPFFIVLIVAEMLFVRFAGRGRYGSPRHADEP